MEWHKEMETFRLERGLSVGDPDDSDFKGWSSTEYPSSRGRFLCAACGQKENNLFYALRHVFADPKIGIFYTSEQAREASRRGFRGEVQRNSKFARAYGGWKGGTSSWGAVGRPAPAEPSPSPNVLLCHGGGRRASNFGIRSSCGSTWTWSGTKMRRTTSRS